MFHSKESVFVNKRPHERVIEQGIADLNLFVGTDQVVDKGLFHRRVNDDPSGGGAALSSGTHSTEQRGPDGHVHVCVFGDDNGIVAAKFQQGPS